MHRSILVLALLINPVLANADDSADLKTWVRQHPISETFPLGGEIPKLTDAGQEKWRTCLNSGLFPNEVAYLADAIVATGTDGNQARHRALTDAVAGAITLNSFSASTHEALSGKYPLVRTWLLIHADPSRQKKPGGWVGMLDELNGLQLPPEAVAAVMARVLDTLDDSNWNKGLTAIQKLRFYLELGGIDHKQLQSQLFIHRWELGPWSPPSLGDPKQVMDQLNALLTDHPDRVSWASFFFSWAWGNHWINKSERLDPQARHAQNARWAKGFQRVTTGTWLQGLAAAYVGHSEEPEPLVVYALFEPAARAEFHRLPLGLQQQIATAYALRYWLRQHPEEADAVLTCCTATIANSIRAVTDAPSKFDYTRHATTGEFGRAISARYNDHTGSCRTMKNTLQKALDDVFAQDLGTREAEIRSGLKHVFSLLEKFEFLEERSQAAGK